MGTQDLVLKCRIPHSIQIVTVVGGEDAKCHDRTPEWFRRGQERSLQADREREEVHTGRRQYSLLGKSTRSDQYV